MNLSAREWLKKITTPRFRKIARQTIVSVKDSFLSIVSAKEKERIEKEKENYENSKVKAGIAKLIGREGDPTYANDGFLTTHYVSFLHNEKFTSSYKNAFINVPESIQKHSHIEWRAHICCWAASRAIHLEGDFIELGVWYGIQSKTVCEYVSFEKVKKNFYLVDSFGKMPGSHTSESYQNDIFDIVKDRFSKYPNVKLIRGLVPDILDDIPTPKVAYLSIDMNGHEPEKAALEYYYDKLVPGAVVYFDDYGWGYAKLREVVDNFLADKPEELLHFPSGNSIFVKV